MKNHPIVIVRVLLVVLVVPEELVLYSSVSANLTTTIWLALAGGISVQYRAGGTHGVDTP